MRPACLELDLKADPLGSARTIILVVNRIGIDGRTAHIVKGNLAAVDSVRTPKDSKFLRDELGLYARSGKLKVCCPEGFWRRGNVEVVCRRYHVPLFSSLDELIDDLK